MRPERAPLSQDIQVSKFESTTLQSDETVQHFKQQYKISWMTSLEDSIACNRIKFVSSLRQ